MLDLSRAKERKEIKELVRAFVDERIPPVAYEGTTQMHKMRPAEHALS